MRGEGAEWAGLGGQAAPPLVCECGGTGWMRTCVPPTPTALYPILPNLESDLTADLARTGLTKPNQMLVLRVGATRRGGCKAAAGSLAGKG